MGALTAGRHRRVQRGLAHLDGERDGIRLDCIGFDGETAEVITTAMESLRQSKP